MIERSYLELIKNRIKEPRRFIQVVVGPRQVGKTTVISQLEKKLTIPYISVSADDIEANNQNWICEVWENARLKLKITESEQLLLIIDEIQKIEQWSEFVKKCWDQDTKNEINIKVILLGSSRLLIQKGLTESLAGRFEKITMGHWTFLEMKNAFGWNIQQYIYFGGYPGAAHLINDETRWKSYIKDSLVETTLSKDILMLTRVDKPALLKRVFEIGSSYSGQIFSLTKLMGELQNAGNTTTLSHYLNLLSECGLLGFFEKFAIDMARIKSSIPKFQVYNNALLTAQTNYSFQNLLLDSKLMGRLTESAVGAHLINYTMSENIKVMYWRERNEEVDFIIKSNDKVIALEVKTGKRTTNKGIQTFNEMFKPYKTYIVGSGGLSVEDFLSINPIEL